MKDFNGKKLRVGDDVIFLWNKKQGRYTNTSLEKGKITGIREKTVLIKCKESEHCRFPASIAKIDMPAKWNKYPESKPAESGEYLVTIKNLTGINKPEKRVKTATWALDDWLFEGWEDNKVTHWQEFPGPAEEEDE
jgi:hypothetical protein